jgi:CubicO group peptidase (beta-lactamase class C family)
MRVRKNPCRYIVAAASALLLVACATSTAPRPIERSPDPIDAAKQAEIDAYLARAGSQSLLILRDGKIAYQYGDIHRRLTVHSIRKAILSGLIGIQVGEGTLDVDATLEELDIDDIAPSLTQAEKQATVLDLLRSRSGIYHDAAANSPGMLRNRPERGAHEPGEHFYYNNWDFNALGGIVEQAADRSVFELFDRHLAKPLGMVDWEGRVATLRSADAAVPDTDAFYQLETDKSRFPAYHFRLSAHDLALYGQLMLQRGRWKGRQLIPAEWVGRSTQPYSDYNPQANLYYGMLWVVRVDDAGQMSSFHHTGVGVHFLGIYPTANLVIVHRVDTESDNSFERSSLYRLFGVIFGG